MSKGPPSKCKRHPSYQAKGKPIAGCKVCSKMWSKEVKRKEAINLVVVPVSDEEGDPSVHVAIRDILKTHRKSVEFRLKEGIESGKSNVPLSEGLDGGVFRLPTDVQNELKPSDCIALLRGIVCSMPNTVISRNYFRVHSGINESTWNKFFGTFLEFKRQAGVIINRGAHRFELYIAKHASSDAYKKMSDGRRGFAESYLRPKGGRFQTYLAASDFHDIDCDPFALRVFLDTATRLGDECSGVILAGDTFDLPEFGKYAQDPRTWDVVGRIKFVHNSILGALRERLPNTQIDMVEGNHEGRMINALSDTTPAMKAILSDLHNFNVQKLFGLDKYQVNYIAKGDLSAMVWRKKDYREEISRNWKIYHDCLLVHHFPWGRKKGLPGFNGHHHRHLVDSYDSPIFGPYEWHQVGAMHIRDASYTDGEAWNNGFLLIHVDTQNKRVQFEYVSVGDFSFVGGKFYNREPNEYIALKPTQ